MTAVEQETDASAKPDGGYLSYISSVWLLHLLSISTGSVSILLATPSIHSVILLIVLFAAWRWLPVPFAFGIGIIGVSTTVAITTLHGAFATLALWGLLIPESVVTSRSREVGWLVVATLTIGAVLLAALRSNMSLFTVALIGATGSALTYYILHRYEKVRLGLIQTSLQQDGH